MARTIKQFFDYMEMLAGNHVDINHSEQEPHFARIFLDDKNTDPFGRVNLNELLNKLKATMKLPVLVAVAYNASVQDDGGDNRLLVKRPMFLVLNKAKANDLDDVIDTIDACTAIAQELIGYIDEDYFVAETDGESLEDKLLIDFNDMSIAPVAPTIRDLCGAKVDFSFRQPHEAPFAYKQNKFNSPV